ncbi:PDZ domain-containing protein [Streptomyces sp. NBC_00620]|uniref:PDZ domain-containing protein n=1 Tax=Streptomyces sp. NBC_00620 TaxID=2903666 RepID=UPI002258A4DA|nr:PDZ domain-containing protein [Streptomyces sp. NBC_00620]MCX4978982.1 PDZ domain-containing protein [Streptomyces sp. NBC_00620]
MEQTALRPKPMPGQEPGGGRPSGAARRPHAARRRGKRLMTLLFGLFVGTVLVLSGVGLGTVGATVIGMSKLADLQKQAAGAGAPGQSAPSGQASGAASPGGSKSAPDSGSSTPAKEPKEPGKSEDESGKEPVRATLGVEAVDASEDAGALVVGVHIPGPGYAAGLVRGDVLLAFGETRIGSAADLARAVAAADPGRSVTLTVRHANGNQQQLSTTPGVVT